MSQDDEIRQFEAYIELKRAEVKETLGDHWEKRIPDYIETGRAAGLTDDELRGLTDPRAVVLLDLATRARQAGEAEEAHRRELSKREQVFAESKKAFEESSRRSPLAAKATFKAYLERDGARRRR
jgi:hypothetical protein